MHQVTSRSSMTIHPTRMADLALRMVLEVLVRLAAFEVVEEDVDLVAET